MSPSFNDFDCNSATVDQLDVNDMPLPDNLSEEILNRDDGSCRDINFDHLEWDGAVAVVASLLSTASKATATDGEGRTIDNANMNANDLCSYARSTPSCRLLLTNVAGLFRYLQVFICSEDKHSAFVEMTFFPDDVLPSFTTQQLFKQLIHLATIGNANNFFLRHENASWNFGSSGLGTGVIVTWHDIHKAT